MNGLPPEALTQVAAYFQALSEPTRLQILNLLREGAQCRRTGRALRLHLRQYFRHLSLLTQHGLVARESRGNSAYYRIADTSIYELCDLVCGNIARKLDRAAEEQALFVSPAAAIASKAANAG